MTTMGEAAYLVKWKVMVAIHIEQRGRRVPATFSFRRCVLGRRRLPPKDGLDERSQLPGG